MRFCRDLSGANQVQLPVPVYDASALYDGQMVMLGTTDPDSGADGKLAFINAYTASSAEAVKALGIIVSAGGNTGRVGESVTVTNTPVNATAAPYLNCIVNPKATYYADYDQSTTMTIASTSTTTWTVTSEEDDIDGSWVFVVTASTSGNAYNLRQLTASASGSATLDSALTGGNETGTGTAIKILKVNHKLTALNTTARGMLTAAAAGSGVKLLIRENYIYGDGTNPVPLRNATHRASTWNANTKFAAEIVMLDHVYNS